VVTGHNDDDLLVRDEVDKSVLVVDAPRPSSGQVVLERLGLTNAGEGVRRTSSMSLLIRTSVLRSILSQDV
jgi:hypothetical protein